MRQKYLIFNSEKENELVIRESAELDKGVYSVLLKETYDSRKIKAASEKGNDAIIAAIRTNSFFPVSLCAERLAQAITEFYKAGGNESVEIQFNDLESLSVNKITEMEEEAASDVELDKMLEDDSAKKDSAKKDSAKKDSAKEDSAKEDSAKEDSPGKDEIKETSSKASPAVKVADDNGAGQDEAPK